MEQVRRFLETLRDDPKAREILSNGKTKPDSNEEIVAAYVEVAKKLGYDLTAKQIVEGIREKFKEQAAITAQAENAVKELDPEELDKVAGGKGNEDCMVSFNNYENCWWEDGCDRVTNSYHGYLCSTSAVSSWIDNCANTLI